MKETFSQIRALFSQLEQEVSQVEKASEFRSLSGLELPDIICDVVDLLMPEIKPYELALYIHFIRHSVIANGTPYFRASIRGLQSGVIKSSYSTETKDNLSYEGVKATLVGLEKIKAIRQEGEPNRDGTLYRILLPEEIPACQLRRARRAETTLAPAAEQEADFYNVRENRVKIYERDNYQCTYCGKQLTRFTATLDHVTPVCEGGDNSVENLKTSCLQCNSRKTSRPLGDFLAAVDRAG
jgi:hypothetical protein